jgi:hypothetical protein
MRSSRLKNSRPLGSPRDGVAGTPDALEQGRDGARAAYLTAEIYLAHVDAELERRGRNQGPEATLFEPRLGGQAVLAREAAVVGRDAWGFAARVQALAQVPRNSLGHAPGVDEDDGRAMPRHQIGETSPHTSFDMTAASGLGGSTRPKSQARRWPMSTMWHGPSPQR